MDSDSKKSLILIDDSNFFYGFKKHNWKLDYKKFYQWLNKSFNVLDIYFFGGVITQNAYMTKNPANTLQGFIKAKEGNIKFFKFLKDIGFIVKTKPVTCNYDDTDGEYKRKCNFDVEITIIAIDQLDKYDELVLCSGDGDFVKLLKYIKGKHKKTTLIAHKDRINSNLKKTANKTLFLKDLRKDIEYEQ